MIHADYSLITRYSSPSNPILLSTTQTTSSPLTIISRQTTASFHVSVLLEVTLGYLLSSDLMAWGLMGPVRIGLVAARGAGLSCSVRSVDAPWWFGATLSMGLPAPSIRADLAAEVFICCCCSEKNLWVDCSTSALCLA